MASAKPISTRQLGRNGPQVPALGYGLKGLSHGTYGAIPSDDKVFTILDRAYELGNRFWDSSDLYGDNEELLGRWFKRIGKRNDIFLAIKFGFVKGGKGFEVDSSYEYCKKAYTESLRLLDVDCIDLYYLHSANPQTPIEETMRALAELQTEGKIRYIGLLAISGATLRRAVKVAPVAAVQTDYSLFELSIEREESKNLLAACGELGVAVVAAMPHAPARDRDTNVKVVQQFKAFADKKGCSTAQLALAWLLKQGDDIIPIPGTKKIKYLEENWAALDMVLSDEEDAEIRRFLEKAEIAGGTLPPAFMGIVFKDTVEDS